MRLRKTGVTIVGWVLVVLGLAALVLPGPGLLLLLSGLIVLSQEYDWAERRGEPGEEKGFDVPPPGVPTPPRIVRSALGAGALIAAGVLGGFAPPIPSAGP